MRLILEKQEVDISTMFINKKRNKEIIEETVNKALLMILNIEELVSIKEKELKDNELARITENQLNMIKRDIAYLKIIFINKNKLPDNYYMESYATLFKCSDWKYDGDEEKEIFKKLSELNSILKQYKQY